MSKNIGKRQQNIFGKIIALTKEIHLTEPPNGKGSLHQFRGGDGKTKGIFRISGIYLNWWFTDSSRRIIEELVEMATEVIPDLRAGSRDSLGKVIVDTLKDNALNRDLFVSNKMFLGNAKTMFEARAVLNVQDFADLLWNKILQELSSSISKWLVIFPLIRVKSTSVDIGYDGISLLSPDDKNRWSQLSAKYKINLDWDLKIGGTEKANLNYFIRGLPFMWLSCEVAAGTFESAKEKASRRMRSLTSVLLSVLYQRDKWVLTKSSMVSPSDCIQFPAQDSTEQGTEIISHVGELLPPLSKDMNLSEGDINNVKDWYDRFQSSPNEIQKRCVAASQFLNYGAVAGELERFIHFFISLDALFGVRGHVEKTITHGLKQLYQSEPEWEYRASRLFDLRSTLVHGGCASIDEWDGLERYRRHTDSHPLKDVTDAAMKALWLFPNNLMLNTGPPSVAKQGNGSLIPPLLTFMVGAYLGLKLKPLMGNKEMLKKEGEIVRPLDEAERARKIGAATEAVFERRKSAYEELAKGTE